MKVETILINQTMEPLKEILGLRMKGKFLFPLDKMFISLSAVNDIFVEQYTNIMEENQNTNDNAIILANNKTLKELYEYPNEIEELPFTFDEFFEDISNNPSNEEAQLSGDTLFKVKYLFKKKSKENEEEGDELLGGEEND